VSGRPINALRQRNVVPKAQERQQRAGLRHKAHMARPLRRERVAPARAPQRQRVDPRERQHVAGIGAQRQRHQGQQRALAAAGRPHHRDARPLRDLEPLDQQGEPAPGGGDAAADPLGPERHPV